MKQQAGFHRNRFLKWQPEVAIVGVVTLNLRTSMTMRARFIPVALGLLFLAVPAVAQTPGQRVMLDQTGALRQEGWVRVQSTINFFVAGPTGESEEAQKLRDRARRTVYEMAARECDLLRDVIAKDCRLEQVSNNINRQYGQQQQEGFNITGSMNFQITLK
jgi:hypothetical protein